jgi:S1-C subfamily serine protease
VRKGYGFGGYCTNNENLLKYGVVICEEIDQNDITAKPLESIDKYVFKLLSIYDTGSKNNFNLNPDIGIEVVQKRKKSAVEGFFVTPENEVPEIKKETKVVQIIGTGSGFYVTSKGHIITNNHVIDKCEKVLLNNETLEVLSVNKKADLALLKSKILETPFLYLRQNKIKQGEDVVVIGYPFGKDINKESTITKGIISALVGLGDDDSKIQIDAAIQPGNSGGPTIGLDGQVVGVTVASANIATFLEAFGTITQNMNFSVKPKYVIKIMNANGVEVPILDQQIQMNTAEIYEYANPATVYLECWGRN